MATRLFLVGLIVTTLVACKGSGKNDEGANGTIATGSQASAATAPGLDAIEKALMSLGIDGRVQRVDLNERGKGQRLRVDQAYLTRDSLLLESGPAAKRKRKKGYEPVLHSFDRNGLMPRWVTPLREPTIFPAAASRDVVVLVSRHFAHAIDAETGQRAMRFATGSLAGISAPYRELPFTPTGGAAVGNDTFYIPSLGSARNNKTIESFSLVTGSRGWGYRTSADIMTTPVVGGPPSDPKLYLVTRTGHVICMDATNYGFAPRSTRWEELLEAGVAYDLFVTDDTPQDVGSVFLVDREGMVYCLNRVTGVRRWVNATGRTPTGGPQVVGDICVVPMTSGLCGFDANNIVYSLRAEAGPSQGAVYWVRTGPEKVLDLGLTLKVEGENLIVSGSGLTVDGEPVGERAVVVNGSRIRVGGHVLRVEDRGSEPLWCDLPYDEIVSQVGEKLIARKGNTLVAINRWTGEAEGPRVTLPGARLIPANTTTGNLFVVGGDAVVYALFVR